MKRALVLVALVSGPLFAQDGHTPSAVVEGNSIIVDADSAVFTDGFVPDEPPAIGTVIAGGNNIVVETRAPEGIQWDNIPTGTYELTIFGRPDDYMNPNRQKRVVTLVVEEPTRQERITVALKAVLRSRTEMAMADAMLTALSPTPAELLTAMDE